MLVCESNIDEETSRLFQDAYGLKSGVDGYIRVMKGRGTLVDFVEMKLIEKDKSVLGKRKVGKDSKHSDKKPKFMVPSKSRHKAGSLREKVLLYFYVSVDFSCFCLDSFQGHFFQPYS